jgi:two-component system, NtrC family, response regulator AtoC
MPSKRERLAQTVLWKKASTPSGKVCASSSPGRLKKMEPDFSEKAPLNGIVLGGASPLFVEGISPSVKGVECVIRELAASEVPVLILAEHGAGKRATAERIHQLSARLGGPFQVLACRGMMPEALQAREPDSGAPRFQEGTLFLEEIGDLSAACQQRLFEMLPEAEEKTRGTGIGARLICGTAKELEAEVRSGRFREDLYYRISGVSLRLPPLRQRREDIPHLVSFFLEKYSSFFQLPRPTLSPETQQLFAEYGWPGNVRELEDAAKAIVVMGDEALAMGGLRSQLVKSERNGERVSLKEAAKAASREAEKELILKVLNRTRWNRRRAAQELQISYKALLYKLKQIGYGEYGTS